MDMTVSDAVERRALPPNFYTDPVLYAELREKLLFKSWHYVCHQTFLPAVGDYYAVTILDQDLFVIRGRDQALHCYYNVCQHRGHTLVQDTGRTKSLVCPYHAWTYGLDGRLRGAPNSQKTPGFDRSKICLTEVRLEVFLGFVFINFDDDARSMETSFAGVAEAALALCPDLEARQFADGHSAMEHCNWLAAVENYNECYHCGHCHKSFSSGVIDPKSYNIMPFGDTQVLHHQAGPAEGDGSWYDTSGSNYGSFYLFPLFSLQIYPGGVVNTYYWRPLSYDNTEVYRAWYSQDGVVEDQMQIVIDMDRETTFTEDLYLVKAVQRGLGSRGYRPGPLVLSPSFGISSEHSIQALHNWVRESRR